ncbi:hypothetical protein HYN48_09095 [Flavobacterium magnum]|uniref:Uncharacterized protein n=1 Tax=Flavobacterium magnum TaxID=2162713 RepID=A0A2S0REZ9_9FLAO|nr:hypothetical protein HYN48_09095 [Flavobacterium magnum]
MLMAANSIGKNKIFLISVLDQVIANEISNYGKGCLARPVFVSRTAIPSNRVAEQGISEAASPLTNGTLKVGTAADKKNKNFPQSAEILYFCATCNDRPKQSKTSLWTYTNTREKKY